MNSKEAKLKLLLNRIPTFGIIVFTFLFYFSSTLYPGGSQASLDTKGFDWINNYWCNLMAKTGLNGEVNTGRPFAILAMLILCLSVSFFFYQFAEVLTHQKMRKNLIKYSGILSMLFAMLVFTEYHDLMTILSSVFGLIAILGIIGEIYKSELMVYKLTGFLCLIILGLNNIIYYSTLGIEWLPLLQKVTFFVVLMWILGMNTVIRSKLRN